MITTQTFPCNLPKEKADALNRESGRQYTSVLIEHYRVYRHTGHWLAPNADQKLGDFLTGATLLTAHSRDAAQQVFSKACRAAGLNVRYPYKRKYGEQRSGKTRASGEKAILCYSPVLVDWSRSA